MLSASMSHGSIGRKYSGMSDRGVQVRKARHCVAGEEVMSRPSCLMGGSGVSCDYSGSHPSLSIGAIPISLTSMSRTEAQSIVQLLVHGHGNMCGRDNASDAGLDERVSAS